MNRSSDTAGAAAHTSNPALQFARGSWPALVIGGFAWGAGAALAGGLTAFSYLPFAWIWSLVALVFGPHVADNAGVFYLPLSAVIGAVFFALVVEPVAFVLSSIKSRFWSDRRTVWISAAIIYFLIVWLAFPIHDTP